MDSVLLSGKSQSCGKVPKNKHMVCVAACFLVIISPNPRSHLETRSEMSVFDQPSSEPTTSFISDV